MEIYHSDFERANATDTPNPDLRPARGWGFVPLFRLRRLRGRKRRLHYRRGGVPPHRYVGRRDDVHGRQRALLRQSKLLERLNHVHLKARLIHLRPRVAEAASFSESPFPHGPVPRSSLKVLHLFALKVVCFAVLVQPLQPPHIVHLAQKNGHLVQHRLVDVLRPQLRTQHERTPRAVHSAVPCVLDGQRDHGRHDDRVVQACLGDVVPGLHGALQASLRPILLVDCQQRAEHVRVRCDAVALRHAQNALRHPRFPRGQTRVHQRCVERRSADGAAGKHAVPESEPLRRRCTRGQNDAPAGLVRAQLVFAQHHLHQLQGSVELQQLRLSCFAPHPVPHAERREDPCVCARRHLVPLLQKERSGLQEPVRT
eukprot:Rhum_TRINITY_DN472_c0_g1::Rhum_TRINITY_DN472_c0_g1_i1::g.1301::m.1301